MAITYDDLISAKNALTQRAPASQKLGLVEEKAFNALWYDYS